MFQDANDFDITSSHFTTVHGGVHVYAAASPADGSIAATKLLPNPQSTDVDSMVPESDLYANKLWGSRRGFPLFVPSPHGNLPEDYRKNGVSIGDVGRITPEGVWDFFFNVYLPADHPINGNRVPASFSPMPMYNLVDILPHSIDPGSFVCSSSIAGQVGPRQTEECLPGVYYDFRCRSTTGALLTLPFGSSLEKLQNVEALRQYAANKAEDWYRYVNCERGRQLVNGMLYLITGCEKAQAGGIATYQNYTENVEGRFQISYGPTVGDDAGRLTYDFTSGGMSPGQTKTFAAPRDADGQLPNSNQTIFLHGFTMTLAEGIWGKLFGNVGISQIAQMRAPGTQHSQRGIPFGFSSSSSFFSLNLWFGGGSASGTRREDTAVSEFSGSTEIPHPSNAINTLLLEKVPSARVAITHDDLWCEMMTEFEVRLVSPSLGFL
ncbi:hypothetical protein C8F01DRAFT_724098 [Mycena amicta]|nr:hypothetical protein C8F01DRAFT_724098 [Mycena amicta]